MAFARMSVMTRGRPLTVDKTSVPQKVAPTYLYQNCRGVATRFPLKMIPYNCCLRRLVCVDNGFIELISSAVFKLNVDVIFLFFLIEKVIIEQHLKKTTRLKAFPPFIGAATLTVATVNGKGANHIRSRMFGPALGYSWNICLQEHAMSYCFEKLGYGNKFRRLLTSQQLLRCW